MEIFLIAAITADGFIARASNDRSFNWTSIEDKKFYVKRIKQADVIVMGSKTFSTFSRYPKNSSWIIYTKNPKKFVNPKPDIITAGATDEKPKQLIARLKKKGLKTIAICGGSSIYTMFLKAGLVNKMFLTIEPVIFGKGVNLLNKTFEKKLKLNKIHKLSSQTMVLEYSCNKYPTI